MSIPEGHFRLYSRITPALKAGLYRFTAHQELGAIGPDGSLDASALPVEVLTTHVDVTSPRYLLPADQVLSTYPPAGTEGSYGAQLPQVVIKRRTLPWERQADPANENAPWLALVVFAEGEAEVLTGIPAAECVTADRTFGGVFDIEKASSLSIRKSMIDKIMPTRKDVPLLAHAREVDINDTELMMGDDDGFLAVVVANRLPLAGKAPDGSEAPILYHACLVNLENQFDRLLPESPPHTLISDVFVLANETYAVSAATYDHIVMEQDVDNVINPALPHLMGPHADNPDGADPDAGDPHAAGMDATAYRTAVTVDGGKAISATTNWATEREVSSRYTDAIEVAGGKAHVIGGIMALDPVYRFPCLLHWTWTTTGSQTFESLMQGLDSGLLGTTGEERPPVQGRPPLEVVETGHVGLDQRTRRGDLVRAWYRGPLLPHPADLDAPRLTLAHAADQLRMVIPDGREDLSLASAFEIGRLLALSQPAMVAALLRWRQNGYQVARRDAVWAGIIKDLGLFGQVFSVDRELALNLGRGLVHGIAANPEGVIGSPKELFTPGRAMGLEGRAADLVTKGFGIDIALDRPLVEMVGVLRDIEVPQLALADLTKVGGLRQVGVSLGAVREIALDQMIAGSLSDVILGRPGGGFAGPGIPAGGGIFGGIPVVPHGEPAPDGPDELDRALRGEPRDPGTEIDDFDEQDGDQS
ncbi:MAG: hypothetical protein ACOH16_07075 [Propionibacteriaceae bacterium]